MPDPEMKPTPAPRPGAQASSPSASRYVTELPYAEELQALLDGKYIVESFLGQGGMGAVYKGLQMPLKRPVAIKILAKRQESAEEDEFAFEERFKREAFAMAALTHPNIVQVYDCGDAGDQFLFISMELVEGGDLSDLIKAGKCTPETALKLIPQICDGLQAAHERGLVHRDIKPANIFMTADGKPKVADFGLAKKFDVKSTFVTKTGLGMGTPDYAAPEQYEGVSDIDHRADIYAFGVMMYQMITGTLPRGNYKPASQRVAIDPRIDAVISKAMEPDRADRYQSAAQIKEDLLAIVASPAASIAAVPSAAVPVAARPPTNVRQPSKPTMRPVGATSAVPMAQAAARPAAAPQKKGPNMVVISTIAVVVLGLAAFFFLKKTPETPGAKGPSADLSAAPKPVAVKQPTPAPPATTAPAPTTPVKPGAEKWVDAIAQWFGGTKTHGNVAHEQDGSARLGSGFTTMFPVPVSTPPFRDQVARVRWRPKGDNPELRMHVRSTRDGSGKTISDYNVRMEPGERRLRLGCYAPGKSFQGFIDYQLPGDFDFLTAHTLELRVEGDRLTVTLDGRAVIKKQDTQLSEGHPAIGGKNVIIESFEYASLDAGEAMPAAPQAAPKLGDVLSFSGHRYQYIAEPRSWSEAKAKAERMGGHLAAITGEAEHNWLWDKVGSKLRKGNDRYFLGAIKERPGDTTWAWVTGEPFSIQPWMGNFPNDKDGGPKVATYQGRFWDDVNPQFSPLPYLVEWDTLEDKSPAPPTPAAPLTGPVDLLALVEVKRDAVSGAWEVRPDGLAATKAAGPQLLGINIAAPEEYDFEIEFTPLQGKVEVSQVLPLPGDSIVWKMGMGGRPNVGPFCFGVNLDGKNALDDRARTEAMITRERLKPNQRYRSVVEVRKGSLRALIDGDEVLKWSGDLKRLSNESSFRLPNPKWPGLGCYGTVVVFHKAVLRPPAAAPAVSETKTPEMPAAPPAAASSDPRIAQLEAGFKARYEADAAKPFQDALAKLNQSYVANGIGRARTTAQAGGDMALVKALDAEKTRVEKGEALSAQDDPSTPPVLKSLRESYRSALARIEGDRARVGMPLYDLYLGALDAYVVDLTKAGKISEAQNVQALRDSVAREKEALGGDKNIATAATPAPPAPSAPAPPPASSKAGTTGGSVSPRQLAEWILSKGGTLKIADGGRLIDVKSLAELPKGRLDLVEITARTDGATEQELATLAGAKDVTVLRLDGTQPQKLDFLREMKNLHTLFVPGPVVAPDSWSVVGTLASLRKLVLTGEVADDQLSRLNGLKGLIELQMERAPTGTGLAGMAESKKLTVLNLGDNGSAITDEGLRAIAATFPDLVDCTLAAWDNPTAVTSEGVKSLLPLKHLRSLVITGKGVDDQAFETLSKLRSLQTLGLENTSITGAGISALASLPELKSLHLRNSTLSDSGLEEAIRLKTLKTLSIERTNVSAAAAQKAQLARPDVRITK